MNNNSFLSICRYEDGNDDNMEWVYLLKCSSTIQAGNESMMQLLLKFRTVEIFKVECEQVL